MSAVQAKLLVESHNRLGEMPRWDPLTQSVHWIDVPAPGRAYQFSCERNGIVFTNNSRHTH